jgi:hypothetical protein
MISDRKAQLLATFVAGLSVKFDAPPFPANGSDELAEEWILALARGVHARLAASVPAVPFTRCARGHQVYATKDGSGEWWSPARCPVCNQPVHSEVSPTPPADAAPAIAPPRALPS